jgi:hypothetical protein
MELMRILRDSLRAKESALVISERQEKWLAHNANPTYSDEALEFAQMVLSSEVGGNRARKASFRASALGSCPRKQALKAAGAKSAESISARTSSIFATGNFLHLKWQMQGLTEGWLKEAEVPVDSENYDFGGTLDGVLYDDSLFEFKSINPRGYADVNEWGPKKLHIRQAHGYMWLKNLTAVSFVYENKADQEWREFRIERDDRIIDSIIQEIEALEGHNETKTLPLMLDQCIDQKGMEYRYCEFKDACFGAKESS